MTDVPDPQDDPAVTGVPPETPEQVRPSATGLVAGPIDGDTDVVIAEVDRSAGQAASTERGGPVDGDSFDQTLQDAEAGIEGSILDVDES